MCHPFRFTILNPYSYMMIVLYMQRNSLLSIIFLYHTGEIRRMENNTIEIGVHWRKVWIDRGKNRVSKKSVVVFWHWTEFY